MTKRRQRLHSTPWADPGRLRAALTLKDEDASARQDHEVDLVRRVVAHVAREPHSGEGQAGYRLPACDRQTIVVPGGLRLLALRHLGRWKLVRLTAGRRVRSHQKFSGCHYAA
jgi:hypothetical protein